MNLKNKSTEQVRHGQPLNAIAATTTATAAVMTATKIDEQQKKTRWILSIFNIYVECISSPVLCLKLHAVVMMLSVFVIFMYFFFVPAVSLASPVAIVVDILSELSIPHFYRRLIMDSSRTRPAHSNSRALSFDSPADQTTLRSNDKHTRHSLFFVRPTLVRCAQAVQQQPNEWNHNKASGKKLMQK